MPQIEPGFVSYLSGIPGLAALVSNRLYPQRLPESVTMPAIAYRRVSGERMMSHSGPSGVASPRYQMECWGMSYAEAKQVAEQVRIALDGYKGLMGSVPVQGTFVDDDRDRYDSVTKQHFVQVDAIFWHEE
jgi:hypothetical protein